MDPLFSKASQNCPDSVATFSVKRLDLFPKMKPSGSRSEIGSTRFTISVDGSSCNYKQLSFCVILAPLPSLSNYLLSSIKKSRKMETLKVG